MLTSCGGGSTAPVMLQTTSALQITTSLPLSPAFDPSITDYVYTYKQHTPLQFSTNASPVTKVAIADQTFRAAPFTTQVSLTPGQSFSFVVNSSGSSQTYYIRCLPTDFPTWTTERPGTPQAEYYVIAPDIAFPASIVGNYAIIADNYGVPLWWYRAAAPPLNSTLLPDGNMAWLGTSVNEERKLNGSLVRAFKSASSLKGALDFHELRQLANGDYLSIVNVPRGPVDLSAYGGSASATVQDNVIEEVTPSGTLAWHWSAMDHIPVSQIDPNFYSVVTQSPADPYHMNAIEPVGDDYIISFRNLSALFEIDKTSGNILWKLGGTPQLYSLTFVGDRYSNIGGQHDPQVLSDGTLTLHDNGSTRGRAPRAVRYTIDPVAQTATFIEQVTDADVPSSGCCGSARKLASGDWVMSWGENPYVTELTPAGQRVFRMTFQNSLFSYRAVPIPPGVLSRAALRQGMDAQFPR